MLRRLFLRIPLRPLLLIALLLGLAPFRPEPHLVEKLRLLAHGDLRRPLDIFDLLLHAAPLIFLLLRLWVARTPEQPADS